MSVARNAFAVVWFAGVASAGLWGDAMPVRAATPSAAERDASSTTAGPADGARRSAREAGCLLFTNRARTASSDECLGCHRRGGSAAQARACHPVAIDYARASRSRSSLRPLDEVVRRGVFLPEHQLRCVTCHDERSPWAHALALPPGTTPTLAVDATDPRTQGADPSTSLPAPGDRVSSKPLCVVCHDLD